MMELEWLFWQDDSPEKYVSWHNIDLNKVYNGVAVKEPPDPLLFKYPLPAYSSSVAPEFPRPGEIWHDTKNGISYFYNGKKWVQLTLGWT